LRLIIGMLLLIFGLQWLRKAILRASGYKALRDEEALYEREIAEARAAGTTIRVGNGLVCLYAGVQGVFLEGLEVAFIVLTFGTTQRNPSMVGHAYRRHSASEYLAVARDTHPAVMAGHTRGQTTGDYTIRCEKVRRAVLLHA